MTRFVVALSFALLAFGCASGDLLLEEGFAANPAGSGTWWVSFGGDAMSAERARDVLLYNSARLVIDNGGTYFTFEQAETRSQFDRERSRSVDNDPSLGNPSGESYRSGTSMQRVTTVSAIVEIVDAPGEEILAAAKVLEELTAKYAR